MNEHRGIWRGKAGDSWVVGYLMKYAGSYQIWQKDEKYGCTNNYIVDEKALGECTGLTDKNGKLVFEGDILGFDSASGSYDLVEYHNGVFGVRSIPEDGGENYSCCEFPLWEELSTCVPAEIIGNIHDNPDLMKGADI